MTRPGTSVALVDTPSVASVPTDTGTAFMQGLTDRGPLTATLIHSLSEFSTIFGPRVSYSVFYDSVDAYFREGGNRVYISRVVGPSATVGTHNLLDSGAGISLVVNAIGPGSWSSSYKVAVVAGVAGGTFRIHITDSSNNVLEDSGDLLTQADAIHWSLHSSYVRIVLGATALVPAVVAVAALSAGTDDRGSVVDASWLLSLNMFSPDLGPGQVMAPGRSTFGYQQLIDHATANNRVALLDFEDTSTLATLEADATGVSSRFAAGFAPWVVIPGITNGSDRTIPPSPVVAGIIARNDPSLGPNRPSAGGAGVLKFAKGLSQPAFTDANRQTLNDNGVNVIRFVYGQFKVYGWRSLTSDVTDSNWIDFGNARLYMALSAQFDAVGEDFMFDEIDGQNGQTIGNFHTSLAGVCLDFYNSRQLFGDTADQAFSVDTGNSVNTLTTIAQNELHAVVAVKMAPMAEFISINVVKALVSDTL